MKNLICFKYFLLLTLFCFHTSDTTSAFAKTVKPTSLKKSLEQDLKKQSTQTDFSQTLKNWEKKYGASAVAPLVELAKDGRNLNDQERYIAILGAARLGGTAAAPMISPLLNDRSWYIKSAAIKALVLIQGRSQATAIEKSLGDAALIVRSEAAHALGRMGSLQQIPALVRAIKDPRNYHGGKPQWVPKQALEAITQIAKQCLQGSCDKAQLQSAQQSLQSLSLGKAIHAELKPLIDASLLALNSKNKAD